LYFVSIELMVLTVAMWEETRYSLWAS
jgi:hypothetical protein